MRITTGYWLGLDVVGLFSICKDNKKDANHNLSMDYGKAALVVFDMQR